MMKKRPFDHETAIQEVTRGYELTTQIQSLLQVQPLPGDPGSELAGVLFDGVRQALMASLSILKSGKSAADPRGGGSPEPDSACSSNNQGSEGSGERGRSSAAARNHHQGRRGRRRHLQSRTEITSLPDLDGHQWRKYGQKNILNSKYPRCYYRCTHRDGQSCPATKQVQQKDCQDPPMFHVTYLEQHTCRTTAAAATPAAPQLVLKDSPPPTGPRVLSFGSGRLWCGPYSSDERVLQNASYSERPVDVVEQANRPSLPCNTLECSGEQVSQQLVACSSSNHPASPAPSAVGPMGTDDPIFGVEIGDGDVFSYPSPGSQGWIMDYPIMDRDGSWTIYPIMDSLGCDFADVECFLS